MRTFVAVFFGVFFGVLAGLNADRWILAMGWMPTPTLSRSVVKKFSPDDVEITVRGVQGSQPPRPLAEPEPQQNRRQYPQGEIYWTDPNRPRQ